MENKYIHERNRPRKNPISSGNMNPDKGLPTEDNSRAWLSQDSYKKGFKGVKRNPNDEKYYG